MKRASIILLVMFAVMHCAAAYPEGELIEIQAQGSGTSREQALMNAIDEALRKSMGTLFLSREEITNDELTDKVVQVSRGSIKHSEIISERSENGKIMLDVKFSVDPAQIRETVRRIKPGLVSGGAADIVRRPFLERGRRIIRAFFEGIDVLEFLDVRISEIKIDPDKEEFSATITLTMNTEKYRRLFASPMTAILDDAVLRPELNAELAGEAPQIREAGIIYLLGDNKSFRAWTLPLAFLEEMMNAAGLDDSTLQTQKRVCVNISFLDQRGKELELQRIPIMFPITNILMFSASGKSSFSPWTFAGGIQPKVSVICAHLFGLMDTNGRRFSGIYADESDPLVRKFTVHLPRATLSRIRNASSWLQIEK
ncbi:MAG: hypothetical protein IJS28_05925 [Synergistaceae bacterium]|nr:hypothetical protein [Synergistaceae bacterium]